MLLFYLIAFLCGTNSLPLQNIDRLLQASVAAGKESPDLLESIKSNPAEFVSEMQQLDPTALKNVIALLEGLLATSEARETTLIDELGAANTALDAAGVDVVQKEDAKNSADQAVADAQQVAAAASTDLDNARSHRADKQDVKDAAQTAHDDELPDLNNEQQVLRDVIAMLQALPGGQTNFVSNKWEDHPHNSLILEDNAIWNQNGACDWCGVRARIPFGDGQTVWKVNIEQGTYHQIGVALKTWGLRGTDTSSPVSDKFAFLYSHNNGWDRFRGAAIPVGSPNTNDWWSGTWDQAQKGREFTVTVDMDQHTFEVETEVQWLGKMKFPDSWTDVYPAVAGQSVDHIYRIL